MNNKVLVLIYTCLCLCIGSATHLKAQTFNYSQLQEHPRLLLKQGEETTYSQKPQRKRRTTTGV